MEIGSIFIVMTLIFYTNYLFGLINFKKRKEIKKINIKLTKLRKISVKTLKEQKEFINLRYGKYSKKKRRFTWFNTFKFIVRMFLLFLMFRLYSKLLTYIPWEILLWHGILFMFLFPILVNYILSFFGLQKKGVKIF